MFLWKNINQFLVISQREVNLLSELTLKTLSSLRSIVNLKFLEQSKLLHHQKLFRIFKVCTEVAIRKVVMFWDY